MSNDPRSVDPLGPEEVAEKMADARPGYELVDFAPVGLPLWRTEARVVVLVRKPVPTIDEFVLRAVTAGMDAPEDISGLLGLDMAILDAVVVDLIDRGYLRIEPNHSDTGTRFTLRELGRSTLDQLAELTPEEKVIWVNFDGLLRRPVGYIGDWYEPREMREVGLREIGAVPARAPNVEELRADLPQINRLLAQALGYRETLEDVLSIKHVERRSRVYQPAVALVYRSLADGDIQVALAVEGEVSTEHERAFAAADLAKRFGVGRNGIPMPQLLGSDHPQLVIDAVRSELGGAPPEQRREQAGEGRPLARAVPVFEHPQRLRQALGSATKRLLIVSLQIGGRVVDRRFLEDLEHTLERGVDVYIGWEVEGGDGTDRDVDKRALDALRRLSQDHPNLTLKRMDHAHSEALIQDAQLIITAFNWLSFRGVPKRTFRDGRGLLVTDPATVDEAFERYRALIVT